jgi:hypothetical protein
MAWHEDRRRVSNGEQVYGVVGSAMRCRPSVDFCGYCRAVLNVEILERCFSRPCTSKLETKTVANRL